jgi:hypothetical protein
MHMKELNASLNSLTSADERYKSLQVRYMQVQFENKRQERDVLGGKRRFEQATKEKDAGEDS